MNNLEQGAPEKKSYHDVELSRLQDAVFENTFILEESSPLVLVKKLIDAHFEKDYYVYEKPEDAQWHIALGVHASLVITSETTTYSYFNRKTTRIPLQGAIPDIARSFFQTEGGGGWNVYGQASFEYAAYSRGLHCIESLDEGSWPLLSLMVPRTQIIVTRNNVNIRTRDLDSLAKIKALLESTTASFLNYKSSPVDTKNGRVEHQKAANEVLSEIRSGRCEKVILSRQINVPKRINMLGTYLQARPSQTPSRSYLVKFMGREVLGFSPEMIVTVKGRVVSTEPVAGTRPLHTSEADKEALRKELHSDPKEIVEHAISVRESVREMEGFSQSVNVGKFMSPLERGSVQHIASEVTGILKDDKDAWDAFDVLFPSITASGIPKTASIEAILRIEQESRGPYSGAILMLDQQNFEACLVLRSVFQEPEKSWMQAGCGMVGLSTPEREFTETIEKFAGIAPYIVCENE